MVNFCLKRNIKLQKNPTLTSFHYIMNSGIFGTQTYSQFVAYSKAGNIPKFKGIYIPVKQIVMSFGNSSRL